MKQQPVYLTPHGIEKLRQELDELVQVKRPALAKRLRQAIQQGDLSENADYIMAKEDQGFLEGRIQQIEAMLRNAVIIEQGPPTGEVHLGSRVTVVEDGSGDEDVFTIVGPAEADPGNGRISHESPMGKALMGQREGDVVEVNAPAGPIRFRVVAIE